MENIIYLAKNAVDELGDIRSQIKELKKREEQLKETLLNTHENYIESNKYVFCVISTERTSLDTKRLKEDFGTNLYDEYGKTTAVNKVVITRR